MGSPDVLCFLNFLSELMISDKKLHFHFTRIYFSFVEWKKKIFAWMKKNAIFVNGLPSSWRNERLKEFYVIFCSALVHYSCLFHVIVIVFFFYSWIDFSNFNLVNSICSKHRSLLLYFVVSIFFLNIILIWVYPIRDVFPLSTVYQYPVVLHFLNHSIS